MLVTCPECDKPLTVSDAAAGKKIRCPECGCVTSVPGKDSGLKHSNRPLAKSPAAAVKAARKAVDDDAWDEPKKQPGMGLLIGLLAGGALLLLLVLGGVGAWYFFLRDKSPAAGDAGQLSKHDDPAPGAKEIKVTLANPRIERFGNQIQMAVDFEVADSKANDAIGVFLVFPSDAACSEMVKQVPAAKLRGTPKGQWKSPKFLPQPPVARDTACDIVVRLANQAGDFKEGRELTRLAGVPIPPVPGSGPSVQLANIVAQQNADNSQLIDFSFDCNLNGIKPASNKLWFEAEFVGPTPRERARVPLTLRAGPNLKPSETIVCSALNPFPNTVLCDILVSDSQPGKGNLTRVTNVRIRPNKVPASDLVLTLSNAQAERTEKPANACKISVDLKAQGKANVVLYRCAAVFSIKGVQQKPVEFGKAHLGNDLAKGVKIEGNVALPADADEVFEIIVREHLTGNMTVLGELTEVAVTGTVSTSGGLLVSVNNVRVFKVDDFTVQVQFRYEFMKPPDPMRMYTLVIQRKGVKEDPRVCFQLRGDQVPMKGEFNKRISGNQFGTAKEYRIWAASGVNPFDIRTKESLVLVAKAGFGTPEGKDAAVVKTTVERVDDDTVRVSAEYEFVNGPDPTKSYALVIQRTDLPTTDPKHEIRSERGDKWQKKGQVVAQTAKGPGLGKGKEYRVFMAEGPFNYNNISNVLTVGVGATVVKGKPSNPIEITSVIFTSMGKQGTKVELAYKLTGDSKLNPKGSYAALFQVKGGKEVPFFQESGANLKDEGSVTFDRPIFLTNETVIEVWFVDGLQNRVASNKKKVTIKKN